MSAASPETRKKILDVLHSGNVEITDRAAQSLSSMDLKNPDFTITEARIVKIIGYHKSKFGTITNGSIEIEWKTKSAGFGELVVYFDEEHILHCDNQAMSRSFIKTVFDKIIDNMKLVSMFSPDE